MTDDAPNPVYVSVGHKISLDTAVKLAVACSRKRVPEPIRQASTHYTISIRAMGGPLQFICSNVLAIIPQTGRHPI